MFMWWHDDDSVWSEEVYGRTASAEKKERTASGDGDRPRERSTSTDGFRPANEQWHGYLGLNIIPAFKAFAKDALMHSFLSKMYDHEIKVMTSTSPNGKVLAWSAVAYAPPQEPEVQHLLVRRTPTMNVAMPDLTAEYWNCYVPQDSAPIFELEFPEWAIYSALTLYNTHGLPIASINSSQCACFLEGKVGGIDRIRISRKKDSADGRRVFVNILGGWGLSGEKPVKGPLCALFRVYRPRNVHITPHEVKPITYLIPRSEVDTFSCDIPSTYSSGLLQVAPIETAFANGDRMAQHFTSLINKYMKPLQAHQQGTQFFHPLSVSGLFVNPDATYVIAFVPPDKSGVIMEGSVPEWRSWRPYYGIMAVDYHTTITISSLTCEDLGGWGSPFKVFAFRTLDEAIKAGYDEGNKEHAFLCWGAEVMGPLSIVLRYLHYTIEGDEGEEGENEKRRLCERDGDCVCNFEPIPGCSEIQYV